MIEFNKWVARKATPLLIVYLAMLWASSATAQTTVIKDLRIGDNQGYVRLVMEFDRPLPPAPYVSVDRNRLRVSLVGIDNLPTMPAAIEGITRLDAFRQSGKICIETIFAFVPADVRTFALTGPHRFIIDAYRPVQPATTLVLPEKVAHKPARQPTREEPEPYSTPGNSVSALPPRDAADDAPESYDLAAADITGFKTERRIRFQQRLVAALIVVTSIIAVLLVFLIRTGRVGAGSGRRAWMDQLPPTKDPAIETIDAVIRNHLKTYDRL